MAYPNIINEIDTLESKHNTDISNVNNNLETIKSSYLPLTGGNLYGGVSLPTGNTINFSNNSNITGCWIAHSVGSNGANELAIHGCSLGSDPWTGACLYLHTQDDVRDNMTPGAFVLVARKGGANNIHDSAFAGYPTGELAWRGISMTQIGFPDYGKYYATGLPQYPTSARAVFTAPVDGWFYLNGQRYPSGYTLHVEINATIHYWAPAHYPLCMNICFPMKQGDYVHVYTDNASSATWDVHTWFRGCRGNP